MDSETECRLDGVNSKPFTRARARAAGHSDAEIRRELRSRRWVALRRGVYVEASLAAAAADDPVQRHALEVAGVLLTLKCSAVAGGASAAQILGLDMLARPRVEPIVITDARTIKGSRRSGFVLRCAALPEHHLTSRHGVPTTNAARTVVDLARIQSFQEGVVVADSALRRGLTSLQELHKLIRDCATWTGIARARRVVCFADPRSESALESISRAAIREEHLPAPRTQVTLGDEWAPLCRVDFLWEEYRVVGEADGLAKYEPTGKRTTREIVRAEKLREEWLADAGYVVVRWGWADARNPRRLGQRLRAAFARGAERMRAAS